jgi:hypothetical protein
MWKRAYVQLPIKIACNLCITVSRVYIYCGMLGLYVHCSQHDTYFSKNSLCYHALRKADKGSPVRDYESFSMINCE